MKSLLTFSTCLVMLCLLVYFVDYFRMTSILFDVNKYCRFSMHRLVNWVIIYPLVHRDLKNLKVSCEVHMLVDLITSFVKK